MTDPTTRLALDTMLTLIERLKIRVELLERRNPPDPSLNREIENRLTELERYLPHLRKQAASDIGPPVPSVIFTNNDELLKQIVGEKDQGDISGNGQRFGNAGEPDGR